MPRIAKGPHAVDIARQLGCVDVASRIEASLFSEIAEPPACSLGQGTQELPTMLKIIQDRLSSLTAGRRSVSLAIEEDAAVGFSLAMADFFAENPLACKATPYSSCVVKAPNGCEIEVDELLGWRGVEGLSLVFKDRVDAFAHVESNIAYGNQFPLDLGERKMLSD